MKKQFIATGANPLIRKETGSLVYQEDIKRSIIILPELEALIPPMALEEFTQLEANILREGCREPLQIWRTSQSIIDRSEIDKPIFVLVDGHNRYRICTKHSVDFKLLVRDFADMDTVRDFMIDNQLGRRNLNTEQMAYFRGLKYLNAKRSVGRPSAILSDGAAVTTGPMDSLTHPGAQTGNRTENVLAEQFNVSPKTIRLDASFAKGVEKLSDALKKEVLSRQTRLRKQDIIKLGESSQIDSIIESGSQLETALSDLSVPSKKLKPQLKEQEISTHSESIETSISTVIELANSLKMPDVDITYLGQQLLDHVKILMKLASPKDNKPR